MQLQVRYFVRDFIIRSLLECPHLNSCNTLMNTAEFRNFDVTNKNNLTVWLKHCRQAFISGQNLCECRGFLYPKDKAEQILNKLS